MALQTVLFDSMLDTLGTEAVSASMHTTDGGATGTGEVTGGTYARQAVTWDPASGGVIDASASLTFDIPGGHTVTHLGLWDGVGTWLGSIPLSTSESYGADGTYTVLLLRVTQTDATV